MKLGPRQLEALRQLIVDRHQAFVANFINPAILSAQTRERLERLGLLDPKAETVKDAYFLGTLASHAPEPAEKMTYSDLLARVRARPVPLSADERHAVAMAEATAGQYITGLATRVSADTVQSVANLSPGAVASYRQKVRQSVSDAISQRKTVSQLKSDLGHATGDWTRNLERVANTELSQALSTGTAYAAVERAKGNPVRACKTSARNCCKYCAKLWINEATGKPLIYNLADLEANGTNVGRKASEYLPTVGPSHPSCVLPGTMVETASGPVRIEDVNPGTLVLTHKGRLRPVLARWTNHHCGTVVRLSGRFPECLVLTPNHPVNIGGDWVPAGSLEGSNDGLLAKTLSLDYSLDDLNTKSAPPESAEDVGFADVLCVFLPGCVPTSAIYLNGELLIGECKVASEDADREADLGGESQRFKPFIHDLLVGRSEFSPSGNGPLQAFRVGGFSPDHRLVRCFHHVLAILYGTHRPAKLHGLPARSLCDASFGEDFNDRLTGNSDSATDDVDREMLIFKHVEDEIVVNGRGQREPRSALHIHESPNDPVEDAQMLSDLQDALVAFIEEAKRFLPEQTRLAESPRVVPNTTTLEEAGDSQGGESGQGTYPLYTHQRVLIHRDDAGSVVFGEAMGGWEQRNEEGAHAVGLSRNGSRINANKSGYTGPVLNLSVQDDESYIANGFAVHNCRCVLTVVPEGFEFDDKGDLRPIRRQKLPPEPNIQQNRKGEALPES